MHGPVTVSVTYRIIDAYRITILYRYYVYVYYLCYFIILFDVTRALLNQRQADLSTREAENSVD